MNVFKEYSEYYDLLYKDKDYPEEVNYLNGLIKKNNPEARTILNLGCGTGKHDFLLTDIGFLVSGVDISPDMVSVARSKLEGCSLDHPPKFYHGDVRNFRLSEKFDVVVSLFHVMSYQTTNEDVERTFLTAYEHLNENGIFIFDCWYGPGVLTDRPKRREKIFENELLQIKRFATPTMSPGENCVDVKFDIHIMDKISGKQLSLNEIHRMRYFFSPEISLFARLAGLEISESKTWMTSDILSFSSWNAVFICKKVKKN